MLSAFLQTNFSRINICSNTFIFSTASSNCELFSTGFGSTCFCDIWIWRTDQCVDTAATQLIIKQVWATAPFDVSKVWFTTLGFSGARYVLSHIRIILYFCVDNLNLQFINRCTWVQLSGSTIVQFADLHAGGAVGRQFSEIFCSRFDVFSGEK